MRYKLLYTTNSISHAYDVPTLEPLTVVKLEHGHRLSDTRALEVVKRQQTHEVPHALDVGIGLGGGGNRGQYVPPVGHDSGRHLPNPGGWHCR